MLTLSLSTLMINECEHHTFSFNTQNKSLYFAADNKSIDITKFLLAEDITKFLLAQDVIELRDWLTNIVSEHYRNNVDL